MEEQSPVLYTVEGPVALVTLNRPEKRNALNDALVRGLKDALRAADADESVVAALRGRALAGGCGLATACDLVLAAESARFGYPEVKIGFVPAMVAAILRRNVSEKRAFELLTRGAEIGAREAERLGLVNHVYDDAVFESQVEAYVAGFERVSRSAVQLTKRLLYHMDGMTFDAALQSGADLNAIARMTEDCQQGIARFLKK